MLGLLADGAGDADAAVGYYGSVAQGGSSLAASGRQLLARGRGDPVVAALVIRPEFDSNVAAQPTAAIPTAASARDRDLFLLAELHLRPFTGIGLVVDQTVSYRKQEEMTDYDMASIVSGATWSRRSARYQGALGYHIDLSTLGGVRFQLGHTVDAAARRAVAGGLGVGASYQLVVRTLYPDGYTGYSGAVHTGAARLSWLAGAWELELAGIVARESTADPALSALATGGQLAARPACRSGRARTRPIFPGT